MLASFPANMVNHDSADLGNPPSDSVYSGHALAGNDIVAKMEGVKDERFLLQPSHTCFNVRLG
jgi:hypothetical protein